MKKVLLIVILLFLIGCTQNTNPTTTTTTTTATTTTTGAATTTTTMAALSVSSSAFSNNGTIPLQYANVGGSGQNTSIPLSWANAPSGTQSFVLTMIDTSANNFKHWLVINIPSTQTSLAAGASPLNMPNGSSELNNDFGTAGYGGPAPPQGDPAHDYVTTIYALDVSSITATTYAEIVSAMSGHVLGQASITGKFSQ